MNTKFRNAADFRKSLEGRLQNIAVSKDIDLQRLRKKVAFDRFLARIFSDSTSRLFLKGGYAMELRLAMARATKDIDLTRLHHETETDDQISTIVLKDLRRLAKKDLQDFFFYEIEDPIMDLDNAPYGGSRYPVTSLIDGKVFVQFHLDVGADAVVTHTDTLTGEDWLGYCGISAPTFSAISIEQQWAEKLHAYTLPYSDRVNTRVKDLVDMVLLINTGTLNRETLKNALQRVFRVRGTHPIPAQLNPPPQSWNTPYHRLATECSLPHNLSEAFSEIESIFNSMF